MKHWGIKTRVLFLALAPAVTIALLLGLYFTQVRFVDLERSLNERGLAIARQLAPAAEYGVFSGNREVLNSLAAAVAREADVITVAIRDNDGNILAHSGPDAAALNHGEAAQPPRQSEGDRGRILVSSAPIFHSPAVLEDFYEAAPNGSSTGEPRAAKVLGRVYVALSRAGLIEQHRRLLLDTLAITLVIVAVGGVLALRMGRDVTRPIMQLTAAVQKLADGNLDTRVVPDSAGAIRALENGVNIMAAALKSAHADLEQRIAAATRELAHKREEAENANQAKSRFLASASHDLRQPMHALGLYVAALRDAPLPEDTRRLAGQIVKSVVTLQDLLEALLDISKLDAGVIQPSLTDIPVNRLLAMMKTNYAPAARAKGVEFRIVASRACVRSDPLLLERILLNLVSNAVRYTRRGKILLGCRRRGRDLRIEVWDTGAGIAADQQRLIFEEFHRVVGPERGDEKGFGLGLAIVDRLARLLNHSIEIRSLPGKGSMFAVIVPQAEGRAVEDQVPQVVRAGALLEGARVVVIDDDAAALMATQTLLESWGCEVIAALTGDDAAAHLATLGDRFPEVVVCDYRLGGGVTGVEVIEDLRKKFSPGIQGILVSGDASGEAAQAAKVSGYPLLQKPVRPAKLRALLGHCLASPPGHRDR